MTNVEEHILKEDTTENLFTRSFMIDDINEVVTINRACLPENYPRSFFMYVYSSAPEAFRVALDGTKVVGYVMARLEDSYNFFRRDKRKKGHIISVAVLPQYRRKQLAKKMLNESLDALKENGANECYLEVRESNYAAIRLYLENGFIKEKTIERYYKDGESAILMNKSPL